MNERFAPEQKAFVLRQGQLDEQEVKVRDRLDEIVRILSYSKKRDPNSISRRTESLCATLEKEHSDPEQGLMVRMGRIKTLADIDAMEKELLAFDGKLDTLWDYYEDDVPK